VILILTQITRFRFQAILDIHIPIINHYLKAVTKVLRIF
jgi:hypothetical protein